MIALLLAPGFCNPSLCATAPFQLGSCAVVAAAVPLLVPLQWWSRGTSKKRVFHEYITLDMLMAGVVYPFVHYSVQYQVNQESLEVWWKTEQAQQLSQRGSVSCFSQQSHWMIERKSKIAQSGDTSSEYPPMAPAIGGTEVSWARGSGECSSSQLVLQRLPAEVDSDAPQLPRHPGASEH